MPKNLKYYIPESHAVVSESSTFDQTFQYVGKEEILRGIYYWDSERSVIYLNSHEALEVTNVYLYPLINLFQELSIVFII